MDLLIKKQKHQVDLSNMGKHSRTPNILYQKRLSLSIYLSEIKWNKNQKHSENEF